MSLPDSSHPKPPVAYFCAEFALDQQLPIYSGGLGVLAGDTIRQANDSKLPLIGIGLFYRQGYFTQKIEYGKQVNTYKNIDPSAAKIALLTTAANAPVLIHIPHYQGIITAQVWMYRHGDIVIYLLDTNTEHNDIHRDITKTLYDPDPIIRIRQEMVLGIGGVKLLNALNITPKIHHLNEGHSAFAGFEITANIMHDSALDFSQAQLQAKQHMVFTNHTVVPAGNDMFAMHQVKAELQEYAEAEGISMSDMMELGSDPENDTLFSMTTLALNYAAKANTVSRLHLQIAKTVWPQYHFHAITNGVHMPSWIAPNIQQLSPGLSKTGALRINNSQLWHSHQQNKQALIELVNHLTGSKLNPEILTIVWARRFAGYKRANLVLQPSRELKELIRDRQIQIIFAGKAHPKDDIGKEIIESIHRNINITGTQPGIVFIPNYNIDIARVLVAGADVWLNTPKRGQEASGTSGMKAGANGVLQLSISDGWVDEVTWDEIGWILPEEQTDLAIYSTLKNNILPCYNDRSAEKIPAEWVEKMKKTMQIIWNRYSAHRMLQEYQDILYQSPDNT